MNNFDNVMIAVERMNKDLGIGMRHITISTVGIAPRIRKLADVNSQVRNYIKVLNALCLSPRRLHLDGTYSV